MGGVISPTETDGNHRPSSGSDITLRDWIKADGFCIAWYLFDVSFNFLIHGFTYKII